MQLNPARGRKLDDLSHLVSVTKVVYAAQPREGTETHQSMPRLGRMPIWFMQLNPARGRKHLGDGCGSGNCCCCGLCSSTPRGDGNSRLVAEWTLRRQGLGLCSSTPRGDGNFQKEGVFDHRVMCGLCSSTPRGDGNYFSIMSFIDAFLLGVYAAQPREGTETRSKLRASLTNTSAVYAAQPREGTETTR